jgi:hypothetical protein
MKLPLLSNQLAARGAETILPKWILVHLAQQALGEMGRLGPDAFGEGAHGGAPGTAGRAAVLPRREAPPRDVGSGLILEIYAALRPRTTNSGDDAAPAQRARLETAFITALTSSGMFAGLTIQAVAPAARPSARRSRLPSEVSTYTGVRS